MTDYSAIFMGISQAKPINNYASRIPVGRHRVVLKRYQVKPSQQGNGLIVEADFMMAATGETRGWAWFPTSAGWAGAYEQARSKEFLETCGACIGDTRDVSQIGPDFAGPNQAGRGLQLDCEVTLQTDAAGQPKLNKKGQPMLNVAWAKVPQTLADLKAARAGLDQIDPLPQVQQAQQPNSANGFAGFTQPAGPAQPGPAMFGQPQGFGQPAPAPAANQGPAGAAAFLQSLGRSPGAQ